MIPIPWFKVDDTLALHAKVLAAGNPAMGLWVRSGSWAMQQLTDGFVPLHIARTLGSARESTALVAAGLWVEVEGGYRFHEWEARQPSREKVEAERDAAAERQRLARERAKSQRESRRDMGVTHAVSHRGSHGPPDPTRPDPTHNYPDADASGAAERPKKPAKRATQRPADFRPGQPHIDLAAEQGVDLRTEWAKFCDWSDANGKTYKDWPAALRNWIRNARPSQQVASQPTRVQQHLALARKLAEQETTPQIGQSR